MQTSFAMHSIRKRSILNLHFFARTFQIGCFRRDRWKKEFRKIIYRYKLKNMQVQTNFSLSVLEFNIQQNTVSILYIDLLPVITQLMEDLLHTWEKYREEFAWNIDDQINSSDGYGFFSVHCPFLVRNKNLQNPIFSIFGAAGWQKLRIKIYIFHKANAKNHVPWIKNKRNSITLKLITNGHVFYISKYFVLHLKISYIL